MSRVSAPEIEVAVIEALREHLHRDNDGERQVPLHDRELVEAHVDRIVVEPTAIGIRLAEQNSPRVENIHAENNIASEVTDGPSQVLTVPWSAGPKNLEKGVVHVPSPTMTLRPADRDALLTAIAKARSWLDDLVSGHAASFAEIAAREGKVERHIRFLMPLAFVSPAMASAIAAESAPAGLTITGLAQEIPWSWRKQNRDR